MEIYNDSFFKSFPPEDLDILKSLGTHKYLRKEGERENAKYIYKEKELDRGQFSNFMHDQLSRMKKFKNALTKALGMDLGDAVYHEWVEHFSKQYRTMWMSKHNLGSYVKEG